MQTNELDLKTEAGVLEFMGGATTLDDWNLRCDKVQSANSGYPNFWYRAVVSSGFAAQVAKRWNGNVAINVLTI